MKKRLIMLLMLFSVIKIYGQGNALHSEIQQAKETNIYFESITFQKAGANDKILEEFINPDDVVFFESSLSDEEIKQARAIELIIPAKNENIILELMKVPESFYNYEVITSDGKRFSSNKNIRHYRGIVKDKADSFVAVTFYEDEMMGLFSTNEGNFNIVKDEQTGKYFYYTNKNVKEKIHPECGTVDDASLLYDSEILLQQRNNNLNRGKTATQNTMIDKNVRFYFETEYDIYQTRGSISSVEAFISGLFNQVAVLYQNEDISTNISALYIWISDDPYSGTSTSSLLSQFQSIRTDIIGDLGMLLTFRSVGGGQAAGFNGICNSLTSQKLAVSMLYNSYSIYPSYSWSVYVVTHEFGHLFGSRHTHACVWNGNQTAIDGCAGYVEGSCPLPGIPSEGGTIMSYCHLQSVGINFSLGFGTQPGNVIRNSVIDADCLYECNTPLNITNQTITSVLIINACGDINVQDVTVASGATLTLDAAGETILSNVEVQLGSQLEIK